MEIPLDVQDQLKRRAAMFLPATNNHSRIAFAKIAREHVRRLVKSVQKDTPFFFVTLAPRKYAVPFHEAADFNVERLKAWARQKLEGRSFIGMVEAAHYPNLGLVQGRTDKTVSWHAHLLVWGIREFELKAIVDATNAREEPLIPYKRPAHYKLLTRKEVKDQTLYMTKAPMKEHFVYPKAEEVVDPETGEVTKVKTERWKHKKRPYRRVGLAKMTVVLAKYCLDQLMFAGKEGKATYDAIKAEALEPYQKYERARQQSAPPARARTRRVPRRRTGLQLSS
ncbi:hypothetical protein AA309_05390 [Microvirga vignae]|uniref:Replication protein n=1 Tax=Microvirga vignae TaxID=1225564 RepID=A0A0H1RFU7_9HYPH|nr:hypothetical protein [Microvirga vignae]KLK93919.1 hypothetical protein AA309_05390 [Microvirga vignae]